MLKSSLLAVAMMMVVAASNACASVIWFAGTNTGTFKAGDFNLILTLSDVAATGGPSVSTITAASLVFADSSVMSLTTPTLSFPNAAEFDDTVPSALTFGVRMTNGTNTMGLGFTFGNGSNPVSDNAFSFNNVYEFLYGVQGSGIAISGSANGAGGGTFTSSNFRAIPEPASMALVGLLSLGGTGLGFYRRRRASVAK